MNLLTVNGHLTITSIVRSCNKRCYGRFSTSCSPKNGKTLPLFNTKRNVFQRLDATIRVYEIYVVKDNVSCNFDIVIVLTTSGFVLRNSLILVWDAAAAE